MVAFAQHVPLAPKTTFELGGEARHFVRATTRAQLLEAVAEAKERNWHLHLLGGGSNVIVPDEGVDGLTVEVATTGICQTQSAELQPGTESHSTIVEAEAGEDWDAFVANTVNEGLSGLECLSGIPGRVGATPIQNVGAYGVEVADCLAHVTVFDRKAETTHVLQPQDCKFSYRNSRFKETPNRFIILAAAFRLTPGGRTVPRYTELREHLGESSSPRQAREVVLKLRRSKSMVIEAHDPNRRSAGSFFTHPIVDEEVLNHVRDIHAKMSGASSPQAEVPHWPYQGAFKIPAAWLIERAGFKKGQRSGAVGISSKHALALVHHGGGSSRELLAFAQTIRHRVERQFGIPLDIEPRIFGTQSP